MHPGCQRPVDGLHPEDRPGLFVPVGKQMDMAHVIERFGKHDALDDRIRGDKPLQKVFLVLVEDCAPDRETPRPYKGENRLLVHAEAGVPTLDHGSHSQDLGIGFIQVSQEDQRRAPRVQECRMLIGWERRGALLPRSHGSPKGAAQELPPGNRNVDFGCAPEDSLLHAPPALADLSACLHGSDVGLPERATRPGRGGA